MALKCGHLAVPLQSMGTVLAWQAVQKMLRCAESLFSKGIFRTSLGRRKRLVGYTWQNTHIALVLAKISMCSKITSHDYFVCWGFIFCIHKCACADTLLQMYSLRPFLKNEASIMTRCLSIPCSEVPGEGFFSAWWVWWLIKHCSLYCKLLIQLG